MNKILLIGRLGRDPDARYTNNGTAVTTFSIAVTRKFKSAAGEAKEETQWFTIITWRKLAEICNQYLKKGQKVFIEGRLTQRKYTDSEGVQRTAIEVIANTMEMLTPKQPTDDDDADGELDALLASLDKE